MHFDWFNRIDILQGRWQHGEKVGYCYSSGFEKTLCKWELYVPLVTKGLKAGTMVTAGNEETNSLRHCLTMVFTTCHLAYVSNDIMCMTD
jgi:hypothetical protein